MTYTTTALDLATRLQMTTEAFGLDADTEVVVFADGSAQASVDGQVQRIDGYNAELMARIADAFGIKAA